ncbi:MAG: hypothetical protein QM715_03875 [Nibricoccus sp.]
MTNLPEGWTDDMRIPIAPGAQSEELVDIVFEAMLAFEVSDDVCRKLQTRFGLSLDDAMLALDRVPGGVVRAITANPANCPDKEKDPLAFIAYSRVWATLPRRHLFSRQKKPGGKWLKWFEERRTIENQKG